jgi:Clp amino terminal domain, pathogenicity island component
MARTQGGPVASQSGWCDRPGRLFERFTAQARAAINAGAEHARRADDRWVEPAHLLFGVLNAEAGVAPAVRTRYGWDRPSAQPPAYSPLATGIFTPEARRIVAEEMLISERLDHRALITGHVLLAILERYAYLTIEFTARCPASARSPRRSSTPCPAGRTPDTAPSVRRWQAHLGLNAAKPRSVPERRMALVGPAGATAPAAGQDRTGLRAGRAVFRAPGQLVSRCPARRLCGAAPQSRRRGVPVPLR